MLADWGSKNYPSSTFYFLHARIWELICGSLIAYFIFAFIKSTITGSSNTSIFGRKIPDEQVKRCITIATLGIFTIILSLILISSLEKNIDTNSILFENSPFTIEKLSGKGGAFLVVPIDRGTVFSREKFSDDQRMF